MVNENIVTLDDLANLYSTDKGTLYPYGTRYVAVAIITKK